MWLGGLVVGSGGSVPVVIRWNVPAGMHALNRLSGSTDWPLMSGDADAGQHMTSQCQVVLPTLHGHEWPSHSGGSRSGCELRQSHVVGLRGKSGLALAMM